MLPKVASFGSGLATAAGSKFQHAKPAPSRGHRSRKSIDANPGNRSRVPSSADLPALGTLLSDRPPSRPSTPLPQWSEDLHSGLESAASVLDLTPYTTSLAAIADAAALEYALDTPAESAGTLVAASAAADCVPPAAEPTPAAVHMEPFMPVLPAVAIFKAPALHVPEVDAAPEPALRVFHATLSLASVQELLGNLKHVQHMFRGLVGASSTTSAAAAMAAARMLSRALSRAATRVKTTTKHPSLVTVSRDSMYTLAEFGWVEVMTCDEEAARALGCTEMEEHHADGVTLSYHRGAVDEPWLQIGAASPSIAAGSYRAFTNSPPSSPAAECVSKDGTASPRSALLSAVLAGAGASLTLEGLAEQLVAAGASVLAAANTLQAWLDEQKAVAAQAMGALVGDGTPATGRVAVAAGF